MESIRGRGHAVAGYEQLVADGRIAPGTGRDFDAILDELDDDLPVDEGPSVTSALTELRADEG